MTHSRPRDIELSSVGTDRFAGTNTFTFELRFLRKGRAVTGFDISNFGARNVRFEKPE